ncbi:MAG: NADH-quinone oxidoreductase subunit M [Nitrospirota bacterium]|nr:NADH-quinone oxidoreductase subunit M [Nitrospirota bacterium]
MDHLLTWVIFLPLIGAGIAFLVKDHQTVKVLALVTTIADFLISLPLWMKFDHGTANFQFVEKYSWIPTFNINYHIGVDGISLLLIIMTTFLAPFCVLCSWNAIADRNREFMINIMVMQTAMVGVFAALDMALFYIFWEAMLIPMYLIVGVWGGVNRIYAALKFFIYTLAGSLLLLVAMIYMFFKAGHTFDIPALMNTPFAPEAQFWLFLAMFVAFAIKVPMFPFHTWLPHAHVQAPTAGSVILASVMLKMGAYGFLRFCLPMLTEASLSLTPFILTLSVVAIIYGAYMALAQTDIKKLIAYSSVSHMGFVTIGMFVYNQLGIEGAIMQMVNHGVTTGALFLCVGIIYDRRHTRDLSEYGGLAKTMPMFATCFVIFSMASIGLPGTNGFIGEFMVLLGAFTYDRLTGVLAATGIVLGAVYMLYLVARMIWSECSNPENQKLTDLSLREFTILAPLVVLTFVIGLYPAPFLEVMHVSVEHLINQTAGLAGAPQIALLK